MCFEELPGVDHPTCLRIVESAIERGVQLGTFLRGQVIAVNDSDVDLGPFGEIGGLV
jgi:hypothetical protein